jgi:hypothetical protein
MGATGNEPSCILARRTRSQRLSISQYSKGCPKEIPPMPENKEQENSESAIDMLAGYRLNTMEILL